MTELLESRLLQPPEPGRFSSAELEGLPEPVQRHLAQAIAPGTPLATSGRLRMRGRIKVGRWLPFRARQAVADDHVTAHHHMGQTPVVVTYQLGPEGRIRWLVFDRWGRSRQPRRLRLASVRR